MKSLKVYAILLGLLMTTFQLKAQEEIQTTGVPPLDTKSIGLGIGTDYGGFGANVLIYPTDHLGVFGGLGYAMAGVGFNAGIKYRFVYNKAAWKVNPYLLGMYGYNAAVVVKDGESFNKFFYGPTIGFGLDFRKDINRKGYWSVGILVPVRSDEVDLYLEDLENNHQIEFENGLPPVTFTLGYRFKLE